MIKVAICDDIKAERLIMQNELNRYLKERDLTGSFEVEVFSDPKQLIRKCTSNTFDLFLLDILMPHMTGIETAKELQEMLPDAQFIFVTTTSEFIMDAFSVKALSYLLKPYSSADFDEAMDRAKNFFLGEEQVTITIKTDSKDAEKLNLSDIMYISAVGKSVQAVMKDGVINLPEYSLEDMRKIVHDTSFTEAQSKLFNIENIRHLSDGVIVMRNGEKISVNREAFQKVRQEFIDFYER